MEVLHTARATRTGTWAIASTFSPLPLMLYAAARFEMSLLAYGLGGSRSPHLLCPGVPQADAHTVMID
eukprot:18342-Eustigmatos_ZCMA.PRE.1